MPGFGGGSFRRWRGDINLATLLSLQLLLLAFFVLLTAVSRFEGDRSRSVIASVQATFGPIAGRPDGEGGRAASADAVALGAFREEIGHLARTAIPLTRVEAATPSDVMQIDLPADAFFRPEESRPKPARRSFFRRLVAALAHRPAGSRYELELRQSTHLPQPLAVARAGALARALAAAGVPEDSLSVGIGPGDAGRIRFVIRLRSGARPADLFAGLAGEP